MRVTSPTRRLLAGLAAGLVLTAAATGCGGSDAGETTTTSTMSTATATAPTTDTTATDTGATTGGPTTDATTTDTAPTLTGSEVTVYRLNDAGTQLVATTVPGGDGAPLRSALVALAATPALPTGTQIVGTDVRGDVAHLNLSPEFLQGYPAGGSAAEIAVLAPLVFTATDAASVEHVHITVDGQTPAPAGSQFDWARDFSRADFPDLTISGG